MLHQGTQLNTDEIRVFGRFRLYPARQLLCDEDQPVHLGSRAMEILLLLTQRSGQVVSKKELLTHVWPGSVVQESTLRAHVALLRKTLGDGVYGARFIENLSGRGYRFVAPIILRRWKADTQSGSQPCTGSDVLTGPFTRITTDYALNVPVQLTHMVGRDRTLGSLAERLLERRFVTIAGPGGIGKTTVAIAVTRKLSTRYQHGSRFVDLSDVSDPTRIAESLASVLETPRDIDISGIVAHLANSSMLIVLDNCEHLIDAIAEIAEKILRGAPGVSLLATSREPLRAANEYVHRLAPLETPASSLRLSRAEALEFPAIQLFVERARANLESFELQDTDVTSVMEICRKLEGNPLAIELAAARVDLLGVRGLAARVGDCLELLNRGRRTALPRHQSLRASLDWSYQLLTPVEQVVLRRLAIFSGQFDIDAATAVVADQCIRATEVMDSLTNLAAKSLLATNTTAEHAFYKLSDTTRLYALGKLHESAELASSPAEPAAQDWHSSEAVA